MMKLKFTPNYKTFYNVPRLYSYQDVYLYLLTGGRGIGKTTGVMIQSVQNYNRNEEEFVYVRRYSKEIQRSKGLLDKITTGVTTKGLGDGAFEYIHNKKRVGFAIALTVQQSVKSGVDFSKVTTIIFDEAILKRGSYHYLPDEVETFFELISTIVRERTNYKIFVIGNNADMFNPYMAYFKIPKFDKSYKDRTRGIYAEMCPTKAELLEIEKETPLYKITQGTNYHDYHYDNKVLTNATGKIGVKNSNAVLVFRLVYNNVTLNVYEHNVYDMFVEIREKIIKDPSNTFILMEDNKPNYLYIEMFRKSMLVKYFQQCYYNKRVWCNNERAISVLDIIMKDF